MKEQRAKPSVNSLISLFWYPGVRLFLVSFLALFLELLLIRWVPSHVRIVAYYSNLMLISAFLGLGCGMLLAKRGFGLYKWFAPCLLLLILLVSAMSGVHYGQSPGELRFLSGTPSSASTFPVVLIFVMNTMVFVPLGELTGNFIEQMPPLNAYAWDLSGAIAGTMLFGFFSFLWFSPVLGCVIVVGFYLIYCRGGWHLFVTGALFILSLTTMASKEKPNAIWSPYSHVSVWEVDAQGRLKPVSSSLGNIGVTSDPPFYLVAVNHESYMMSGTIDSRRYKRPNEYAVRLAELYTLPYLIRPGAKEALVLGSGGGMDVEAALLHGAESVDAVEIDPVIIRIGHQYSASQSYKDPRVSIHNTDARAFLRQTTKSYDMIVFGFLDSQGLFSQMSNIRLDGYVHTHESFREAFDLLREGGLLSVSFFTNRELWLLDRLATMVRSATRSAPLVYVMPKGQITILVGKGFVPTGPDRFNEYRRIEWTPSGTPEATDDWPYLYLRRRFIPSDYLLTIGTLLIVCLAFTFFTRGGKMVGIDFHFFFLGAGFLLLETKSITAISLYFGTTWFVSMIVILGVLMMGFFANLAAARLKRFSPILYLPLVLSVGFLYFFPTQSVLGWSFLSRIIFSLAVVPLPIFFAGLIFSSTFRESRNLTFSFGSNLLGAMVGGFVEYLGMITGMKALLLVVVVFYLASLLVRLLGIRALGAGA